MGHRRQYARSSSLTSDVSDPSDNQELKGSSGFLRSAIHVAIVHLRGNLGDKAFIAPRLREGHLIE